MNREIACKINNKIVSFLWKKKNYLQLATSREFKEKKRESISVAKHGAAAVGLAKETQNNRFRFR